MVAKSSASEDAASSCCKPSLYASYFAGFQCASADVYTLRLAINKDANLLNVNTPVTACFVVCVGNIVSFTRRFSS